MVEQAQVQTLWGNILGFMIDGVVGGMLGVLVGLLIEWRGRANYIIKGWGVGLAAWMFFYGVLYHNLPFTAASAPAVAMSNISAFIGHSIFGITVALVYVKIFSKRFEEELIENSVGQKVGTKKLTSFKIEHHVDETIKKIRAKRPRKLH